jgi:hypothetical protein
MSQSTLWISFENFFNLYVQQNFCLFRMSYTVIKLSKTGGILGASIVVFKRAPGMTSPWACGRRMFAYFAQPRLGRPGSKMMAFL